MTTDIDKMALALRAIAEFPVTDPGNMDAVNMQAIARMRLELDGSPIPLCDSGWRQISEAKKDGTIIWAQLRDNIYPVLRPGRNDLARWNGVQVPLRHRGRADDGFDFGWGIAAPVGHGGFPDEWIAGWRPLPPPPSEPGR